jgi:hypothetical protein
VSAEMLDKLQRAGYAPGQTLSCPLGDPCPCEVAGLQTACGLALAPRTQHQENASPHYPNTIEESK